MNSLFTFFEDNILFVLLCAVIFYVVFNSQYYSEHFETEKTLTLYYAPWCPHCKPVKPLFEELKTKYENVKIQTINGDENPEILKERGIKGYPTIVLTVNGKDITFEGERTAEKLQEFIQSY